jgi:hypothetical protein
MSARQGKHAKLSGTEPLKSSVSLQPRQHSTGNGGPRIAPSTSPCEPQTEESAGSVSLPSKRAGLPRTNIQQSGVENEEVEEPAKVGQRSLTQVNC